MACEQTYNFPIKNVGDTYLGTGLITCLSARDVYQTNLSAVEFNFTALTPPTLSAFSWTSDDGDITIHSLSAWQSSINKHVMNYEVGVYQYKAVFIDDIGDRHTLMEGRLQLKA